MKLLIASDIHGSAFFGRKLIDAYTNEQAERLILLGDLLYHGPRNDLPREYNPKILIRLLNNLKDKIIAVHGNCDAEVDQMVLEFPITDETKLIKIDSLNIIATHGHKYNADNLPASMSEGAILLHGHTHVPEFRKLPNGFVVNPGSVSIPKEGTQNSYIIYENKIFTLKNLDGTQLESWSIE